MSRRAPTSASAAGATGAPADAPLLCESRPGTAWTAPGLEPIPGPRLGSASVPGKSFPNETSSLSSLFISWCLGLLGRSRMRFPRALSFAGPYLTTSFYVRWFGVGLFLSTPFRCRSEFF